MVLANHGKERKIDYTPSSFPSHINGFYWSHFASKTNIHEQVNLKKHFNVSKDKRIG
jgi:hypothetical protein